MAKKTSRDLRQHLFLFDAEYPIKKGYVAFLMLDKTGADVFNEIKTIVQTAEPNKTLNEENLSENLLRFKEILQDKHVNCEWTSLIRFYLEPFPIAFNNFPILLHHLQPVLKLDATLSKLPLKPEPSCTASTPTLQTEASQTSFTPPDKSSTPAKSLICPPASRFPSPVKDERDLFACAEMQDENMTLFEDNSQLDIQFNVLNMPIYEREKQWKISLQRLHEMMKKKARAAYIWKGKYAMLKKTTKTARRKWKMLQILEEKIGTLEDELCKAQKEITRLNEIIKQLNSKLKTTKL